MKNSLLFITCLVFTMSVYAASGGINDMQVIHHDNPNNDYYEVKVTGDFHAGQIFEMYINTDNNVNTGYDNGIGAEYLVTTGWDVFKYVGPDGGSWNDGYEWDDYWQYLYTSDMASQDNNVIQIDLGSWELAELSNNARFYIDTFDDNWGWLDWNESGVTVEGNNANITRWDTGAYADNEDRSQVLSIQGANSLTVTIIGETEAGYDYIYIYDQSGKQVAKLDGQINQTLTVQGHTIRARLTSDEGVTASGVVVTIQSNGGVVHAVESRQQASAFLSRASFGATSEAIDDLISKGNYEAWLDEQFNQPASYHIAWAEDNTVGVNGTANLKDSPEDWKTHADTLGYLQKDTWWQIVTKNDDQLRQRVALALSEILVISKNNGKLIVMPDARMSYYDVLVKNALGNFESLLQEVTYHPAMGMYLSYLGNASAEANAREGKAGSHPDENYAREVMQLFTIGLYELNQDGSRKLDADGKPIPTYTQADIREMAKVFTGLTDQNDFFYASDGGTSHISRTQPMIAMDEYHDTSQKNLFTQSTSVSPQTIPSGGTTVADINQALHTLFMHPNTGPFISRQLIQRLVTSNPSPAYVQRVAAAFNDNGQGVRGDLKAVIKAILLDDEAFNGRQTMPETFGKFREPLLYFSHLFRAFHAQDAVHTLNIFEDGASYRYRSYNFNGNDMTKQEAPLEALTVFNYFTPDDAPSSLQQAGLVAPELNVYGKAGVDDVLMGIINKNGFVYGTYDLHAELSIDQEIAWVNSHDYDALLDYLDTLLTGGTLRDDSRQVIKNYLLTHENAVDDEGNPITTEQLARYAIALVMTSPDYALQQ